MNPILFEDLVDRTGILRSIEQLEAANAKLADAAVIQNERIRKSQAELIAELTKQRDIVVQLNNVQKGAGGELNGLKDDVAGLVTTYRQHNDQLKRNEQFLTNNTKVVDQMQKRLAALSAEYAKLDLSQKTDIKRKKEIERELTQTTRAYSALSRVTTEAAKVTNIAERSYEAQNRELQELRKTLRNMPDAFDRQTGAINKQNKAAVELVQKIGRADAALKKMDAQMGQFQRNVGNYPKGGFLGDFLGELSGPAAGLLTGAGLAAGMIALGTSIVSVRSEYERLEKQLETTLGSKGAAGEAQKLITSFAAKSPREVGEVTKAFNRLVDIGIVPTEKELFKISDVAESKKKSLLDFVEAIADAQQGEFERLKEFGVNAQKSGDQVIFTFKGQETAVRNTSSAISEFLIGLGDVAGVAGQTETAGKTLEGRWSTLTDTFRSIANEIGTGLQPVISGSIDLLQIAADKTYNWVKALRFASQSGNWLKTAINLGNPYAIAQAAADGAVIEGRRTAQANRRNERRERLGESSEKSLDQIRKEAQARAKLADEQRKQRLEQEKANKEAEKYAKLNVLEQIDLQVKALEKTIQSEAMQDLKAGRLIDVDPKLTAKVAELKAQYEAIKAMQEAVEKGTYNTRVTFDAKPLTSISDATAYTGTKVGRNKSAELSPEQIKANAAKTLAAQTDTLQKQMYIIQEYAGKREKLEFDLANDLYSVRESDKNQLRSLLDEQQQAERAGQKERVQLIEEEIRRKKELYKEDMQARREVTLKAVEIGTTLVNGLFDIEQQRTQNRIADLEKQKEYELATAGDSASAKEAIEKRYDAKRKEIQRKQDIDARNQALFNIAIQTGMAVAEALPNIPLSIAIGILGAVQAGLVLAKPLPQYAEGKNVSDSYEGPAIAGEAGRELWIRDGQASLVDKPTVIDVKSRDIILPNRLTERLLSDEHAQEASRILHRSARSEQASQQLATGRDAYQARVLASALGGGPSAGAIGRAVGKELSKLPIGTTVFDDRGVSVYTETATGNRTIQRNKHQLRK